MSLGRRKTVKRVAAVAGGMLLVGMVWSGVATAQVQNASPAPTLFAAVSDVTSDLSSSTTSSSTTSSSTTSSSTTSSSTTSSSVVGTDVSSVGTVLGVSSVLSTVSTSGSTASTSSTSSTSGANTVIQYSPYPVPVFGDYGHRYYGKYYDHGCGCDRYAAPTYTPVTVVATQVSSVPKGGVDTGDGSFR